MHISSLAPHPPFVAPDAYHALYDPSNVPPPAQAASPEIEAEQHPWRAYHLYNQKGIGCTVGVTAADNLSLSEGDLRQLRATYYGMMSEVDAQVGRLIDHIESTGEYERTLIVFGSDHGEQLGDHWMFAKYGDFDQSFLNPLILRDPRPEADGGRGRILQRHRISTHDSRHSKRRRPLSHHFRLILGDEGTYGGAVCRVRV